MTVIRRGRTCGTRRAFLFSWNCRSWFKAKQGANSISNRGPGAWSHPNRRVVSPKGIWIVFMCCCFFCCWSCLFVLVWVWFWFWVLDTSLPLGPQCRSHIGQHAVSLRDSAVVQLPGKISSPEGSWLLHFTRAFEVTKELLTNPSVENFAVRLYLW